MQNTRLGIFLFLAISLLGSACSNSGSRGKFNTVSTSASPSATPSGTTDTYKITNVLITTSGGGSSGSSTSTSSSSTSSSSTSGSTGSSSNQIARVFFELGKEDATTITSQCTAKGKSSGTSNKPCVCFYEWQEINPQSGQNIAIRRQIKTAVSTVQQTLVECSVPTVYANEIPEDTLIKLSIMPGPNSKEKFSTNKFSFSKSGLTITGDFQDAEGHSFANIHRYTCYEQFKKVTNIVNRKSPLINEPSTGKTAQITYSTQFCTGKNQAPPDPDKCTGSITLENSSQAYYYNLYIRSNEIGGINAENTRYKCPLIKEPLSGLTNLGASNYYWPLDSSFSLAINPSGDFVVGVESYSKLGIEGDPNTQDSSCFKGSSGGSSSGGGSGSGSSNIVKSCLGFAGKPKLDGTCPAIKTASGQYVFTYRLRRYIVLYPPLFYATGDMLDSPQPTDTIYVLDRPILPPNASFLDPNASPTSPYTMLGPKPCPMAFYDHAEVTKDLRGATESDFGAAAVGAQKQYVSTNNSAWDGTNVDGTYLPNTDSGTTSATASNTVTSCAATLPVFHSGTQTWSLFTSRTDNPNSLDTLLGGGTSRTGNANKIYIRPQNSWYPVYIEDTDFQACAPQSLPLRDPPLHFSKNTTTNNVSWCAAVYPTQNPNATALGTGTTLGGPGPLPGAGTHTAIPYTSAIVKSAAGSACVATAITQAANAHTVAVTIEGNVYTAADAAKTCDRTVMNISPDWTGFPLQARPLQIENAIKSDTSFQCTVTYDNSNIKSTSGLTPTQGCCGTNVYVWTGATASLAVPYNATAAHFEPNDNMQCLTPSY